MEASPFGHQLRHWRTLRGMSQLSLAHRVGGSARHLSFIETGRSRPGEALIHRLADAMGVPKRGRNDLLRAAGFPPLYSEAPLDDPELARYRDFVRRVLHAHRPYPAMAIDRDWILQQVNPSARALMGEGCVGRSSVDLLEGLRSRLENFEEVVTASRQRLVQERFANPDHEELERLIRRLDALVPPADAPSTSPVLTVRYRAPTGVIDTMMTVARFSTANHLELDELRVELIYPVDEAGERFFRQLDGGP